MRHFDHIDAARRKHLFYRHPRPFDRHDDPAVLAVALGATLYSPATRPALADDVLRAARRGVMSMVLCLEDAIGDDEVEPAEANLVAQLRSLHGAARPGSGVSGAADVPLLFVRVRDPRQIGDLIGRLGHAAALVSGFVLPKFTAAGGGAFLDALEEAVERTGLRLLAMPVIESPAAVYAESRPEMLHEVARLLAKHRPRILAVRIGATDMSAAYGLRRPPDLTIYDIQPVAGVICDVVNVLGRADGTGYVVTGPVWEYFSAGERMFKPQLRQSPFDAQRAAPLRQRLITSDLDGLIREVHLDKANGLIGKTVIHPSHVAAVHALSVVTHEEYCDAADILGVAGGGAMASSYANKMNEAKPHRAWAQRLMLRARVFGVAAEGVTFVELLEAAGPR
ncbi:HpcH/HpaI aldolase/citrate lyase family protein [Actinomadura livida]|uniref:Citrate lyase beta subunit n=1 Tax=Actinomadura livida TaxID=79909 RepID=A0A7W7IGE5_9ACTN|nr:MULTISPECIES: HpcH/HpaI aldolase/citrate lyase family protein [Actinomadura]MBB4776623.1 citrate lyase beta subunit [Actinomadura catellatispora]GGT93602.1 ATP/GTP-binding protein [Actinomadura livida]